MTATTAFGELLDELSQSPSAKKFMAVLKAAATEEEYVEIDKLELKGIPQFCYDALLLNWVTVTTDETVLRKAFNRCEFGYDLFWAVLNRAEQIAPEPDFLDV